MSRAVNKFFRSPKVLYTWFYDNPLSVSQSRVFTPKKKRGKRKMDLIRLQCKQLSEQTAASIFGLPVEFLRRAWHGPYNPQHHLFEQRQSRWLLDAPLWEKMTESYLLWHAIPNSMRHTFWQTVFRLILECPEFKTAPLTFRVWLFFKRFPVPPYTLLHIIHEMREASGLRH